MADIFEEVREELKQEGINRVINKFAPYFIVALILIIIVTIISVIMSNRKISKQEELSDIYNQTILSLNKSDDKTTLESLDYLIKEGGSTGIKGLSYLKKASLLIKDNKIDEAIKIYDELYKEKSIEFASRELAGILAASLILEKNKQKEYDLEKRFAELIKAESPFQATAKLLKGSWLLSKGKKDEAKELLLKLKQDPEIPNKIKTRVQSILSVIDRVDYPILNQ